MTTGPAILAAVEASRGAAAARRLLARCEEAAAELTRAALDSGATVEGLTRAGVEARYIAQALADTPTKENRCP